MVRARGAAAPATRARSARRSSGRAAALARSPGGRAWTALRPAAGVDRLREMLVPLQGLALAPGVWERDVLPRRVVRTRPPGWTSSARAASWSGSGQARSAATRTRGAPLPRGRALRRPAALQGTEPVGAGARRDPRAARAGRGLLDRLIARTSTQSGPPKLQEALWDLAWAGESGGRRLRAPGAQALNSEGAAPAGRRFARRRRPEPQVQGRWSLPLRCSRAPSHGPRMRAISSFCSSATASSPARPSWPRIPGGFAGLYSELANLETLGAANAGTSSRASAGAVRPAGGDRAAARPADRRARGALVLAATDPARPYGATLPWPKRDDDDSGTRGGCPAPTWSHSTRSRSSTSSAAARGCSP